MKMEKRPYRSVKEAVELYGQRILAPELYANVLQEIESEENEHEKKLLRIKSVRDELEIAKQNLEKAKERSIAMARSFSSLQEELEETKRKLQMLKEKSDYAIEFNGDSLKFDFKTQSQRFEEQEEIEAYGKRHAKMNGEGFKNDPSLKNKKKNMASKKKKAILFIEGFFSKKKN
ncbi:WEB family protein [Cucurbita argyrosperma subsp. argyrosperma]|uniref:WEB family protein At1g75720-like n=1 Tax=Cucurbita moschata TaxID=3662 RepID=A0A6J1HHG9_CUCMO|nr:WEB family protein At1g75720-like [Cucurbita moschata]KAG7029434.1 WEB family protein [Cucurbita argyrosperma subsp. argyrosperma]